MGRQGGIRKKRIEERPTDRRLMRLLDRMDIQLLRLIGDPGLPATVRARLRRIEGPLMRALIRLGRR